MNTEQKHTPLPWAAKEEFEGWSIIKPDKGIGTIYVALEINQGKDMGESDAAFIIEACNSHYSLKEQNAKLVEALTLALKEKQYTEKLFRQMDSDLYHAQSNLQAVTEANEMLTAQKDELVINLEACEKERLETLKKVVERDGLIQEQEKALKESRMLYEESLDEEDRDGVTISFNNWLSHFNRNCRGWVKVLRDNKEMDLLLREIRQYDYDHLLKTRVSALKVELSEKINKAIQNNENQTLHD